MAAIHLCITPKVSPDFALILHHLFPVAAIHRRSQAVAAWQGAGAVAPQQSVVEGHHNKEEGPKVLPEYIERH